MGIPIISNLLGNKDPPPTPQSVFNNPSISTPASDPSRMQYHADTERFEDDLNLLKATLMGKRFLGYSRENGFAVFEEIILEDGTKMKPFCNEMGQAWIYSFAASRLKPGTTLSNMVLERLYVLMRDDHRKLCNQIYINAFKWEINAADWEALHFSILDAIEMARRRAVDNQERDWITKIWNQITTMSATQNQQQQTGSLAGLFRSSGVK